MIHNMVADDFFQPDIQENETLNNTSKVKFASVGNLIKLKGYDILINAFKKVHDRGYQIELNIIGDGPERNNLESKVTLYGLEREVLFHGKKGKKEVLSLLSSSDCFVLSSRSETFGVVYAEAMAVGIPVIATDCGGPSEFVDTKHGIIVPVEDEDALANAIDKFLSGNFKYSGKEIREYCRELFSSTSIANKISNVYKSIIRE